jgi:hypothetical protein
MSRWLIPLFIIVALIATTVWSTTLRQVSVAANGVSEQVQLQFELLEPALTYVETEGFDKVIEVCPGGTLPPFTYTVNVKRPTVASVVVTWVPGLTGNFGEQSGDDAARFWPYIEAGEWKVKVGEASVPDFVGLGAWRRIVVAETTSAQIAHYVQFVTVQEECPTPPEE